MTASTGRFARATVRRRLPVSAEEAWALVTDVRHHARWVPLTRVEADAPLRVGNHFVAVTGPWARRGRAGIADRMRVERSEPPAPGSPGGLASPGHAVYRKLGPVLLGTAEVRVFPGGPHASVLEWSEDVHLRGLPRALTAWALRPALAAMLHLVVRRIDAELRRASLRR